MKLGMLRMLRVLRMRLVVQSLGETLQDHDSNRAKGLISFQSGKSRFGVGQAGAWDKGHFWGTPEWPQGTIV